jgi:error-prone DNA polymerase
LATIRNGKPVLVAGCVLFRQRPGTASGVTFVTLEDETGMSNLIVHPQVWERHFQVARTATIMLAKGVVQREGEVVHVLVSELRDLSKEFAAVRVRSRDFR